MGKEGSRKILTVAGIGLGALLLAEGGRRIQEMALAQMAKIDAFEDELDTLIKAAAHEGRISSFAMPIDLGTRILNRAVAARLKTSSSKDHHIDLTIGFGAYKVSLAVADRLRSCETLWVRRMDRGFLGKGFKFDIVGEDNLYIFEPQVYRPGRDLLF